MIGHRGYRWITRLIIPLLPLYLLWRGRREPGYRRRWGERFGRVPATIAAGPIWIHAASMGEVQAVAPMLKALLKRHPSQAILITTTTPAGATHVERLFDTQVQHCYLPFDAPGPVSRFLGRVAPSLGLIVEMELWPNLFLQARAQGVPLMLINARLSERSARRYARVRPLMARVLACPLRITAQSHADAERLRMLGAPEERLAVTGSLKFDQTLPASTREQGEALRRHIGERRPVWIAASTRDGEEQQVLKAHQRLRATLPDALLILVPRHPDRFTRVLRLCRDAGWQTTTRSSGAPATSATDVYLVDSLGELPMHYAAADLAFVGGSLVPEGGHNLLEPACLGKPIVVGPHTFNAPDMSRRLIDAGACVQVQTAAELGDVMRRLLTQPDQRADMGRAGESLVSSNRGVGAQLLDDVERLITNKTENPAASATASDQ